MEKQDDTLATRHADPELRVTLLATSDLHGHIQPHDYYRDEPAGGLGLARLAPLVEAQRRAAPNSLLFDNGDTLQGTPLGDYAARERARDGRPHPVIAAMNALGYDAATVGNHDFNYGPDFLTRTLADAEFPVVLANLTYQDGSPFLPPAIMLNRRMQDSAGEWHAIRVGVIGLAPPQITIWDKPVLQGRLQSHPIVATAARAATGLRAEGADLIVALCHSGIGPEDDRPELENAILPLARLAGCDAIVAGHSHVVFPVPDSCGTGILHGTPVVQPGAFGSHLGRIALTLRRRDDGWRVTSAQADTLPARDTPDEIGPTQARILAVTATDHKATLAYIRRRIGATTRPLTSYFALISNTSALSLKATAKRAAAVRALQGHPLAHLPLLAVAAPLKAGGRGGPQNYIDIPVGPLSIRNVADLYSYPNKLRILRLTGVDIRDWLDRAASIFRQITPGGRDQLLIDPAFASYNFDILNGLTYTIDPSQPAAYSADGLTRFETPGRIADLCYQGQPVMPGDEFLVATNSYRASGGGHFGAATRGDLVLDPNLTAQDILIRHITDHVPVTPEPLNTWRFAPMPGTSVIYETGPGAANHPQDIAALNLTRLEDSPTGFARFRMEL